MIKFWKKIFRTKLPEGNVFGLSNEEYRYLKLLEKTDFAAYKRRKLVIERNKAIEDRIIAIQRSTKVTFGFFARTHNFFRQHFRWYYNWHLHKFSSILHFLTLLFYLGATVLLASSFLLEKKIDSGLAASLLKTWDTDTELADFTLDKTTLTASSDSISLSTASVIGYSFRQNIGSFGSGPGQFQLWQPNNICISSGGVVYATDSNTANVKMFSSGAFLNSFGAGQLSYPYSCAVMPNGNVVVYDLVGSALKTFDPFTGDFLSSITAASLSGMVNSIAVSSDKIFTSEYNAGKILVFAFDGTLVSQLNINSTAIAIGPDNELFVLYNNHVNVYDFLGNPIRDFPVAGFQSIAVSTDGRVFVADYNNANINYYNGANGNLLGTFASVGSGDGQVNNINSIAVDNGNFVYVGDGGNSRIVMYEPDQAYEAAGKATIQFDSTKSGTTWNSISWNAATPTNTLIKGRIRVADSVAGLSSATWSDFYSSSGSSISISGNPAVGRHAELEIALESTDNQATPTLDYITLDYDTVDNPAPTITNISPTSGPVGTSVTITGTNFGASQGASTFAFSAVPATPTSWSDTSIVASVPVGAATGFWTVGTLGGNTSSATFTVTPAQSVPTVSTFGIDNLASSSALVIGTVADTGGADITRRGFKYSAVGEQDDSDIYDAGTFGLGVFDESLGSLSPDQTYHFRAYAVNSVGTSFGNWAEFVTLANLPGQPVLAAESSTSIRISLDQNANPATVHYAIYNETLAKYIKLADGSSQDTPDWHSYADWGGANGFVQSSLSVNTNYVYKIKARNSDNIETGFSNSANTSTLNRYTITIDTDGNGLGQLDQATQLIDEGSDLDVNATANASSNLAAWQGCNTVIDAKCQLSNINGDKTITATFNLKTFTVTIGKSGNGDGNLDQATQTVNYGADLTVAATPLATSDFTSWSGCDGTNLVSCILTNVTASRTLTATFTLKTYTVTVVKNGVGDGIFDQGPSITVNHGGDLTVAATPENSSVFSGWVGCDNIIAQRTCLLSGIMENKTVSGGFAIKTFMINVEKKGHEEGLINKNGISLANYGGSFSVKASMPEKVQVVWTGCDSVVNDECVLAEIKSNKDILADFSLKNYEIRVSSNRGGLIEPRGATVEFGAGAEFQIRPDDGYYIKDLIVDGKSLGARTNYTFSNIRSDGKLEAVFAPIPPKNYFLNLLVAGEGQGELLENSRTVAAGQTVSFEARAKEGSELDRFDGCSESGGSTCTILMNENKTITAYFKLKKLKISLQTDSHTQVNREKEFLVNYGDSFSVFATPEKSYRLGAVEINGVKQNGISNLITINNISADQTIVIKSVKDKTVIDNFLDSVETGGELIVDSTQKDTLDAIDWFVDIINKVFGSLGVATKNVSATNILLAGLASIGAAMMAILSNILTIFSFPEYIRSLIYAIVSRLIKKNKRKWGKITEVGSNLPLAQAKVTLIKLEESFPGGPINKKPVVSTYTDNEGDYALVTEAGRYEIVVTKDLYQLAKGVPGYQEGQIIEIKGDHDGLVAPNIYMSLNQSLVRKKFKLIKRLEMVEKLSIFVSFTFMVFSTLTAVHAFLENSKDMLALCALLFSILLWFFNIKSLVRISPWGKVLDNVSHQGIALALIRVFDKNQKQLIRTTVSDDNGKFQTIIRKGCYHLSVAKPGYVQSEDVKVDADNKISVVNKTISLIRTRNFTKLSGE